MKHFNIKDYIDDFKTLPVSLVYSFEDPNEQLNTLNNLILECIKRHALLVKTKFTHPPAPWMKQDISRRHLKILGWCPAGSVLPHGEKVPL